MTIRQMFIPTVGTEFKLEEDWTFPLYEERRNNPLRKALGLSRGGYTSSSTTYNEVTLKKGVTLAGLQVCWSLLRYDPTNRKHHVRRYFATDHP